MKCAGHQAEAASEEPRETFTRRSLIVQPPLSLITAATTAALIEVAMPDNAHAIIPTTAAAGRVPGLSEPDEDGTFR